MMILFQFDWNKKELDFHSQSLFHILKHALDRQKHNQNFSLSVFQIIFKAYTEIHLIENEKLQENTLK